MAEISLPLRIEYRVSGNTSLADVIAALQSAEELIADGVSLLPSFVDGVEIRQAAINMRSLTQESPLRELFLVALIVAFQDDLKQEIPPVIESLFHVKIPDSYDSLLTVMVMIVLFYGVALAKDVAAGAVSGGAAKSTLRELISELSESTGKSESEVTAILRAKYEKPGPVKKLVLSALRFFRPSHVGNNAPIAIDRHLIGSEIVKDVPFANEVSETSDFQRFEPHNDITLELHASDVDKVNSGWAAVPKGVSDARLRMRLISPVSPKDLFGKRTVRGDIVLISQMTSAGFEPVEIHLTAIAKRTKAPRSK